MRSLAPQRTREQRFAVDPRSPGPCAGLFPWGAANVFLVHHLTVVNCNKNRIDTFDFVSRLLH